MRVLRIGLGDDDVVDLHPSVSVVLGLSDGQRRALRRAFSAIGTGLVPDTPGLLEAHGLLLDATQEDLDLLEVPSTASTTVVTPVEVPGAVPADDAERLRTAERDVVLLASDRWRSSEALAHAEAIAARPTGAGLRARAAELEARLGRHEARDAEPVRVALDRVRDQQRAGATPDGRPLVDALAGIGLDVGDLGLPIAESVRMAMDWLDERQREAAWAVGAVVELRGIVESLDLPDDEAGEVSAADLDHLRRRAQRATELHADAIDRTDELRRSLAASHTPRLTADELERHLSNRLLVHRPDRLAGAVPMLLDGVLGDLDDPDVHALLDRLADLAGGVQLVVVDDHPAAPDWARAGGPHRAAVVTPSPDAVSGAVR